NSILAAGIYVLNISINDTLGNLNWTIVVITVTSTNTVPSLNLTYPLNLALTNRTPIFNWTCSDAQTNCSNFEFVLNESLVSGGASCSDDRQLFTTNLNHSIFNDLNCLADNGYIYNWSVRAFDGTNWTNWTYGYFNISALLQADLTTNETIFGAMNRGDQNDTVDNSPQPFLVENTGNTLINISYSATALWSAEPNGGTSNNMLKVSNSSELGAFIWLTSAFDWLNIVYTGGIPIIDSLNYSDATDTAEIDINITVPSNESFGTKNSTVTLSLSLAE
ncbi:MAG: hypothetical protein ACI83O_000413, partial [Patescibacteria group bacterium]